MILPARLRLDPARRLRVVAAAAGREPADLALTGGRVLDVFTGRVSPAAVGVAEGRIAWVRETPGPAQRTIDLGGRTVVPGLIDAHCHADMLCAPTSFAAAAAGHGTTAGVVDAHALTSELGDAEWDALATALETAPLKFLWGLRPSRDSGGADDTAAFPPERLRRLLARPGVSGAGELTAWRALLAGDERLAGFVADVLDAGLRVDGHVPGARRATLEQLTAAGLTSDHEAISGAELADRISLGLWTMVRHSSLRPDGVELGRAVAELGLPQERLLLTADGVVPADLAHGHLDTAVRKVIEGGVDAADAVRMATIRPATYLGVDGHLGAVAAGRCADLVVVDDIERFTVERVLCDGVPLEELPVPDVDWSALRIAFGAAPLTPAVLEAAAAAPAVRFHGAVPRLDGDSPGGTLLALVARDGTTLTAATTDAFAVRALATSVTGARDVLLIGRDTAALVECHARVVELGGGMVTEGAEVPLPVLGHLSPAPIGALAEAIARFEAVAGVPDAPPFSYLTTFLTLPALPGVCLTAAGLLDVKSGEVILPNERLA